MSTIDWIILIYFPVKAVIVITLFETGVLQ